MVSNMSAYSDSDMPCASISAGVRGGSFCVIVRRVC